MTYQQAIQSLPEGAWLNCTFGYPGVAGYEEWWRVNDGRRFVIGNGPAHISLICNVCWTFKPLD